MFQSTHPRGVRPPKVTGKGQIYFVFQSTHPRGVRPAHFRAPRTMPRFNPRTRVGCDCAPAGRASGAVRFQSTHPRGVRRNPAHRRSLPCSGFNPRTRVGCDLLLLLSRATCLLFQSTHPRGVRQMDEDDRQAAIAVSIHAPAWGATTANNGTNTYYFSFNPRTRVGCDCAPAGRASGAVRFQSTHPRGVRRGHTKEEGSALPVSIHAPAWGATLILALLLSLRSNVSIHAPAWGATYGYVPVRPRMPVSIHAPAWGATLMSICSSSPATLFQSTHPRGVRRRAGRYRPGRGAAVSIHAPAWGATRSRVSETDISMVSIHAPAWGATPVQNRVFGMFQGFNPRTRVGCDQWRSPLVYGIFTVSIHAPAWGATFIRRYLPSSIRVSIHAPAWGATPDFNGWLDRHGGFNPRTRVGCDWSGLVRNENGLLVSIHAPAWGATRR